MTNIADVLALVVTNDLLGTGDSVYTGRIGTQGQFLTGRRPWHPSAAARCSTERLRYREGIQTGQQRMGGPRSQGTDEAHRRGLLSQGCASAGSSQLSSHVGDDYSLVIFQRIGTVGTH